MSDITYRFNDEEISAPENLSVEEVRNLWKDIHPALDNAEAVRM